jgi:hypothetical protein
MDTTTTTEAIENTDAQANPNSQATETEAQEQGRMYSQSEFDDAMAKMKHAVTNKAIRPYQELGDLEELRQLKTQAEQKQTEEAMKKGEFEKVLSEMASKKDAEIAQRDSIIREYRVDTPLVNAAAKYRSINPEQVKSLLKSNLRLGSEGEVEVVGADGTVRYTDNGTAMGVDDLVKEFLDTNPHFVSPTPSTTNTQSSVMNESKNVDVSKLDMSNPEHRKIYAELRKQSA